MQMGLLENSWRWNHARFNPRSELKHEPRRNFGAELVRREIVRTNHVAAYPNSPPLIVPADVYAAARLVRKRRLRPKRGLRGEMRPSEERVSPEF